MSEPGSTRINCSNVTHNGSDCVSQPPAGSSTTLYIFVAIQILLVIFIFIGNTLILVAIKQQKLMRKVSYYFIANLAVADILFGLALALRLVFLLTGTLNTATCVLILYVACVSGLSSATGILFLCLESSLAVRHMIIFKTAFTPKRAWTLIIGSWLLWCLFSCLMLYHPDADVIPPAACNFAHPFFNRYFLNLLWALLTVLMIVVIVLEVLTLYHVRKHVHNMIKGANKQNKKKDTPPNKTSDVGGEEANTTPHQQGEEQPSNNVQQKGESERQKRMLSRVSAMSQLVALILASYVVTWGPYTLAVMLMCICPSCGVAGLHLVYLTLVISLNSAANVVIFAVKSREFRKAFKKMCTCSSRGRASSKVEPIDQTVMSTHRNE